MNSYRTATRLLRTPAAAGLGTGIGLAALFALLDRPLYQVLIAMPGMILPRWLEIAIHLSISVLLAIAFAWVTARLRWYGSLPGIACGALTSLVYLPLAGADLIPPLWLAGHLAWGWALGAWIGQPGTD